MKEKEVGNEDYKDKEDRQQLILDLTRLRLLCSGKHPLGSLFYKVAEWKFPFIVDKGWKVRVEQLQSSHHSNTLFGV